MKYLFTLIFCLIINIIHAQHKWNLQQCIDTALQNNIQIQQQRLNTEISKLNLNQSKFSIAPNLNASASHVYNYGRTIDMYTNEFASEKVLSQNFYLSSSMVLFNGFQLLNNIRQNYFLYMAGKSDLEKIKNDMILTIATAYLQVLYNTEIYENAKNQYQISLQQVERTKILVNAGTLAQGNLFTIESQASTENYQMVAAQNQLQLSYLTLSQLIDIPSPENFEIEKPLITISPDSAALVDPKSIYDIALKNQPEILSAEFKLKGYEKSLNLALGSRSPSLSMRASYGTGYSGASKRFAGYQTANPQPIGWTANDSTAVLAPSYTALYEKTPFNTQIDDNLNKSIGFYLTIPIFNNWQSNTNINKAKIAVKNYQLNYELTKNNLRKTIFQAYYDAKAALNKFYAAQKAVDAMEESFRYTQQKFDVGMINSLDYNDSKNKLSKSKSDLIQARYEFVFRLKVLEFYQGKAIVL